MAKGENKIDQVLDIIKEMTIIELRDLNQKIQDEFGITAGAGGDGRHADGQRSRAATAQPRRPRRGSPGSTS